MKILKYLLYLVVTLFAIKFAQILIVNNIYLDHYSDHHYDPADLSSLQFLNIQEPYILHYNLGNAYYQTYNYPTAITEYNTALNQFPSEDRVCDIRVNLALSMVAVLKYEIDSPGDLEKLKSDLNKTLDVLRSDDCANATDTGKSEHAEQLEKEIEEYLKSLETNSGGGGGDEGGDEGGDDGEQDPSSGTDSREDELNNRTDGANDERNQNGSLYEWFDQDDFYHGIRW